MRPPALGSMVNLGHVETILADDVNWDIRYLIIAARTWLPGKLVQLAPYAVTGIDWPETKSERQRQRHAEASRGEDQRRDRPDVALGDELASSALNLARWTRGSGLSISWSGKRNFAG